MIEKKVIKKIDKASFKGIKDILEKKDKCKVTVTLPYIGTVHIKEDEYELGTELYLRYGVRGITIARAQVNNTRSGIMTEVLEELKNMARHYGYEKIVVESVLTESMRDFCFKHNFIKTENCFIGENCFYGDYELKLDMYS